MTSDELESSIVLQFVFTPKTERYADNLLAVPYCLTYDASYFVLRLQCFTATVRSTRTGRTQNASYACFSIKLA